MKRLASLLLFILVSCSHTEKAEKKDAPAKASKDANVISLFNGKDLNGWKVSNFGGEGEVKIIDGAIEFDYGNPMSGITWVGEELPKMNYEVELEAVKKDGTDFFLGLTFPYEESHLSLIFGGWGGMVCGISSFDYQDAANNETTKAMNFPKNQWYKIKLRVEPDLIKVWLDGELFIETEVNGRKVHTRPEVDPSKPFGICSFETIAAYKNIKLRKLK